MYNRPLYKGYWLRSQIFTLPILSIHLQPPRRGQPLHKKKKWIYIVPNVSLIRRFNCIVIVELQSLLLPLWLIYEGSPKITTWYYYVAWHFHFSNFAGSHLTIKQLQAVYSEVKDARTKWYFIGMALGISPDDLDSIKVKCRENPEDCLTDTLKVFLKKNDPKATWAQLADALEDSSVGEGCLADQLRRKISS